MLKRRYYACIVIDYPRKGSVLKMNFISPVYTFSLLKIVLCVWRRDGLPIPVFLGFCCGSVGKESTCNEGDLGSIPRLGRSPGEGKGCPFQYSGLCLRLIDHKCVGFLLSSLFH